MDTYDVSGNPARYYNGEEYIMTWVEGRRLESVSVSDRSFTYDYNADGQRTRKTSSDKSYIEYYVMDGITVGESRYGTDLKKTMNIRYTLDENNSVIGLSIDEGSGYVKYYFAKNLQGDVLAVYRESDGVIVAQYTYDSWGNVVHATGALALTNPFRYRSYYYDEETNFYYLQSRYYDAAIGRFINADVFASSGRGILGNNMFTYCNNNPVMYADGSGFACVPSTTSTSDGGKLHDYIIYYYHKESTQNLENPAKKNHSDPCDTFTSVSSFDELVAAFNNCPDNVDDIYVYLHGDENSFVFYSAQYYSADSIEKHFTNVNIEGNIYLFSCKGGMGDLASTMANKTNCTVIACIHKVSFANGAARCGWKSYFTSLYNYSTNENMNPNCVISWYSFYPDGRTEPKSFLYIITQ